MIRFLVYHAFKKGYQLDAPCSDCRVNTLWASTGGIDEYYMVEDDIWTSVAHYHEFLCIGCLEKRLGRELTPQDFRACPLNFPEFDKSERLASRLGVRFHDLTLEDIEAILK